MCVRAPYKFEKNCLTDQSLRRLHREHISLLEKVPVSREPSKGEKEKENHPKGRRKTRTKPIGGHLQMGTKSIEKENRKDRP